MFKLYNLKLLSKDISLNRFKLNLLDEINTYIESLLEAHETGSTVIFDLKKMRNTPFSKYSNKIINLRKEEFESGKIYKRHEKLDFQYDVSEIKDTYYGQKFIKILNIRENLPIKKDKYKKLIDFTSKLDLKLTIAKSD